MRFGILGPLLVDDGERLVSVPGGRLRVLLAALLVCPGQVVRADALADVMWDGSPPPGAADTFRTYVMRLRRVLGPRAGPRLVTRPPGYLIEASEDEVDLLRFERLRRDGGAAARAGSWPEASGILTEALALWRGPALADVSSQVLQRDEVPRLEQLRLQAEEWRIDADLHLSRHADLVTELQWLAARHPLRERFHAQLMLALYRSGRQAEALAAYQSARAALIEELGSEPGSELRRLHRQILTADPALEVPEPARVSADAQVPRQLPGPVAQFTGRGAELARLTELVQQPVGGSQATVVISAIGGTAGVGKTALAVQWAHQVADRFPDGQLHVNLRGYDPDQPLTAAGALAGFLRALGVEGQAIPAGEQERAARYRSLLSGKRVLIVLDNAVNVAQVLPLLPGSPGCAVVVTSRDALAGLVARDGAVRLDLDLLPPAEAVGLLRDLIGSRTEAEPGAAADLARLCCRLPLALRVAAELAAVRTATPLADLVAELSDRQRRLDLLDADGDPRTAVRAVFSWSYQHLDLAVARAFRLVGLHPGPDLEPYAVAALTSSTIEQTRQVLDVLVRAHLVQPVNADRYGMHDLLRVYARELAARHDDQRAALTRLLDYYLHSAATAMDAHFPADRSRRPRIPPTGTPTPPVADLEGAKRWLHSEHANLVAATSCGAEQGWPTHAIQLAATLARYLDVSASYSDAVVIHGHARRAALESGDTDGEARALMGLGVAAYRQSRHADAADHLLRAVALYQERQEQAGLSRALENLAIVYREQGSYQQATDLLQQALAIHRQAGDLLGQAGALDSLGIVAKHQGRFQQAADYHEQAIALYRETGDRAAEAYSLGNHGSALFRQGRYQDAANRHHEALALFRQFGDRTGEAQALNTLGQLYRLLGSYEDASEYCERALAVHRETGNRIGEIDALNALGDALLAADRAAEAATQYLAALTLASERGQRPWQADAHNGLGNAYYGTGEYERARYHWQQALALYAELGNPQADEVRARLAAAAEHAIAEP